MQNKFLLLRLVREKIPDYTWHHHQDTGRMQLIETRIHTQTGHIGGEGINAGK